MKKYLLTVSFVSFSAMLLFDNTSYAGNKKMVGDEATRLNTLNKEIVASQPDLPMDGKVYLSGNVKYKNGKPHFEGTKKIIKGKKETATAIPNKNPSAPVELMAVVPRFDVELGRTFEQMSDIVAIKVKLGSSGGFKGVSDGIVVDSAHFDVVGMKHSGIKTCMVKEENIYVGAPKP